MKRIDIHFDEFGCGGVHVNSGDASGVYGISLKEIAQPDGTTKPHMQLMVLLDFEIERDTERPEAQIRQGYWEIGRLGDGLGHIQ